MAFQVRIQTSERFRRLTGASDALLRGATSLGAKRAAESWVDDTQDWIAGGKSFTPRTGQLEQSIGWRPTNRGAEVFANAETAPYVEYGTRAHVIRPRPGRQALRFPFGGGFLIRRSVQHPGTKPKPFFFADREARLARALQEARIGILDRLEGRQ